MLAGAAGAALVIGAVYVTLPKFSVRDVEVPRIVMRDTEVPHIVERDVPVDHVVPHDVVIEIPQIVTKDVEAPKPEASTPAERKFVVLPQYKDAAYRGRIVSSRGGGALSFQDGKGLFPRTFGPSYLAAGARSGTVARFGRVCRRLGYVRARARRRGALGMHRTP